MTTVNWMKGDLIKLTKEGRFDAVAHGCNCFHTMGSGIAPKLNNLTGGRLLREDIDKTYYGDINKMGTVSYVTQNINGKRVEFFNLYTQYTYGSRPNGEVYIHWDSLYNSIMLMMDLTLGQDIGIPLIGCGLAGGEREDFEMVMDRLKNGPYQYDINLHVIEFSS